MAQEDKFKREIDRIGLALAKLLSMLLNKADQPEEAVKAVVQQTYHELGIDLEEFLALKESDDVDFLVKDKKFSIDHLRNFGNLLYELAHKTTDEQKKQLLLKKVKNIYRYVSANASTLYLDVEYRLKELG